MIEGSKLAPYIRDTWACELLPEAPPPGYRKLLTAATDGVLTEIGYTIDNTSKTRAIFEINKGVNVNPGMSVNVQMAEDRRRVPIRNMIYIADGPSDVPSFSVINNMGGKTLGVHPPGQKHFESAATLEEQGRVQSMAEANYTKGSPADMWLRRAVSQIAKGIVASRESALSSYGAPPSHLA
jgi:hypothetical protein